MDYTMNNTQVAEAFAKGATKGKSGNVFIDGNTIYSYGYHFPMASRVDGIVYVTYREYSSSTAHQLTCVRQALSGTEMIMVKNPLVGATLEDKLYWENKNFEACLKIYRAKTENSKKTWSNMAAIYNLHANQIEDLLR